MPSMVWQNTEQRTFHHISLLSGGSFPWWREYDSTYSAQSAAGRSVMFTLPSHPSPATHLLLFADQQSAVPNATNTEQNTKRTFKALEGNTCQPSQIRLLWLCITSGLFELGLDNRYWILVNLDRTTIEQKFKSPSLFKIKQKLTKMSSN